jgi:hypothetical protein
VLIQAGDLWKFSLSTVDGAVGRVHDLQMDDRCWIVADIVVGLGHWPTNWPVIVSPDSVIRIDETRRSFVSSLTSDEVAHAPGLATHPSVSLQHHVPPYQYLGLPLMVGELEAGDSAFAVALLESGQGLAHVDRHLRSMRSLAHYRIEADGERAGSADDWIVDLRGWSVRYVVVRVPVGSGRRHVLLPVEWLGPISWTARAIYAGLPADVIKYAPDYRPGRLPDPDYEARLAGWYREPFVDRRSGSRRRGKEAEPCRSM